MEYRVQILVCSHNDFLIGILQSYGHVVGYQIKPINDIDVFLNSIIKEDPSLVFVDMQLAGEVIISSVWPKAWESMQKNKVTFCGAGEQGANDKQTAQSGAVFNEVFAEPININRLHKFLHHEMLFNTLDRIDRRAEERRAEERRAEERRKELLKHDGEQSITASSLNHQKTSNNQSTLEQSLQVGSLSINYLRKEVSVNGTPVDISPKEFELINLLAQQPGCVVKTEDMIKVIWPKNNRATKADVHQYLYMLRKKIETNPHKPKLLVTVKGFGYKLCP